MSKNSDSGERLSPDDAFATLSNETRLSVLRALGEAGEALSFSELRERVGVRDSGQFNYHLEQLVGHFVRKGEEGYRLRPAGRRVVEAVLSGAVTDTPDMERTRVGEACEFCGAPIEVDWNGASVTMYCTECPGRYGYAVDSDGASREAESGYLGRLPLPPAGVQGRSPAEVLRAASTWGNLEILSLSAGICPRCSGTIDYTLRVCDDHDATEGICDQCTSRHAVRLTATCTNCIYRGGGVFSIRLVSNTHLLSFLTSHGRNPVAPDSLRSFNGVHADYEEEILSRDPFRARFTFTIGDDSLALTVDDDLEVVDATRP